jgi:hypothetical protein
MVRQILLWLQHEFGFDFSDAVIIKIFKKTKCVLLLLPEIPEIVN